MSIKDAVPFTVADAAFYDVPDRLPDDDSRFPAADRPAPPGWSRGELGLAVTLTPDDVALPDQGWKIHVSSVPGQAARVIDLVRDHCVDHRIAVKFLRSRAAVHVTNSKYWSRAASGKVVTIYPADVDQFAATLEALAPELHGIPGPYVLSDLRYGDGPLYVRYGAFRLLWCTGEDGTSVPAIRTPDGRLVPDRREPVFRLPDFVRPPPVLEPYVRDRAGDVADFPYEIESALHFSNAGGVYLGRFLPTGEKVVLREGRPHAGLDGAGRDAVTRLENELAVLTRLAGLDCVPRVVDHRRVWEHSFLATEYVEGTSLLDEIIRRYPLVHPEPTEAERAEYVAWATGLFDRLQRAVDDIHGRGLRIGDCHPANILVRPNGAVVVVDLEFGGPLTEDAPSMLAAPGFVPPAGLPAAEADEYALDRVRLMTLLPIVPVLGLDPAKAQTLVSVAAAVLPVEAPLRERLSRRFSPDGDAPRDRAAELFAEPDWPALRGSLAAGILATASPERDDRLFPGDPLQSTHGGATLGYGAAGVLLALTEAGEKVSGALVDWLARAGAERRARGGVGLYDGPHGIAYVLDRLGARDDAVAVLDAADPGTDVAHAGLFGGRAGIALNLLHFARLTGAAQLRAAAVRLGEDLARRLLDDAGALPGTVPGLLRGATGPALLCIRLYEETGDERYLDAAEQGLRADLSAGATLPDGVFHIRAGSRYLVYLDGGSSGIVHVLRDYLRHRDVPDLATIRDAVHRGCRIPFVLQPGLFQGRAGLIATLSGSSSAPDVRAAVLAQVRRLGWHAVMHDGDLAFPGTGLAKLSTDLATGSAGILLALHSVFDAVPLGLPFLGKAS